MDGGEESSNQTLANSTHTVQGRARNVERGPSKYKKNLGITKDSRRTIQLVLDGRTVDLLIKMRNRGVFTKIFLDTCISAGKEASVYYAAVYENVCQGEGHYRYGNSVEERVNSLADCEHCSDVDTTLLLERAVKVFGTSIISKFKNRGDYIMGDYRLETGYTGKNPRKKVKLWAEKEFRNLRRLVTSGIRAPLPLDLRNHTLAMQFLGTDRIAAPRLKNVKGLSLQDWSRLYIEVVVNLRAIYHKASLVHGDFSEYNILYHMGHPYIIDVSQSVDCTEHNGALNFLKRDCINTSRFFRLKFRTLTGGLRSRRGFTKLSSYENMETSDDDESIVAKQIDTDRAQSDFICRLSPDKIFTSEELFRLIVARKLPTSILTVNDTTKENDKCVWPEYDESFIRFDMETGIGMSEMPHKELHSEHQGSYESDTYPLTFKEFRECRRIFGKSCISISKYLQVLRPEAVSFTDANEEDLRAVEDEFLRTDLPSSLQDFDYDDLADQLSLLRVQQKGNAMDLLPSANNGSQSYSYSDEEARSIESSDKSDESNISEGKFTGVIPDNITPKEWKKHVKEMNREKRIQKKKKKAKKKGVSRLKP